MVEGKPTPGSLEGRPKDRAAEHFPCPHTFPRHHLGLLYEKGWLRLKDLWPQGLGKPQTQGRMKIMTWEGLLPSDVTDTAKSKHSLTAGQIHTKPHVKSLFQFLSPHISCPANNNNNKNIRQKPWYAKASLRTRLWHDRKLRNITIGISKSLSLIC